jgi:hypothetical protein
MDVGQKLGNERYEDTSSAPPDQPAQAKKESDQTRLLAILLLVATLVPYLQVVYFPFLVLDDNPQIVYRDSAHHWSAVPSYFTQDLWESGSRGGRYYRPLFQLWLLINYKLFGLHSRLWHAALLLLYAASVFLLWRSLLALSIAPTIAFFTSLLFALHPVHVESVAWLSGGVDPLLGVFVFGGLLAYLKWSKSGAWWWLALAGMLALAAMWTKETGLALPVLMILHSFFIAPRSPENRRQRFVTCVGALVPVAIYAFTRAGAMHTVPQQSWASVVKTAPMLSLFYLRQTLWPLRLAGWYDFDVLRGWSVTGFWLPCLLGIASLAAILVGLRQRRMAAYFGAFWWVALMPSLVGIRVFANHDIAHDRYNYLSVAAICFLVVSALKLLPRLAVDIPRLVLVILAFLLALATMTYANTWSGNEALYRRAFEISPRSMRPRSLLVSELMKKGQLDEALQLARSNVHLDPEAWEGEFTLGVVLHQTGQIDAFEKAMRACIKLHPTGSICYLMLASELQKADPDQALAVLRSAPADVDDSGAIGGALAAIQHNKSQASH